MSQKLKCKNEELSFNGVFRVKTSCPATNGDYVEILVSVQEIHFFPPLIAGLSCFVIDKVLSHNRKTSTHAAY